MVSQYLNNSTTQQLNLYADLSDGGMTGWQLNYVCPGII